MPRVAFPVHFCVGTAAAKPGGGGAGPGPAGRVEPNQLHARHRLKVRYGETDQMGVVYHINYLIWFHEARDTLIRNFVKALADITIRKDGIDVRIGRRANNPFLLNASYDETDIAVPWLGNRRLRINFL